MTEPELYGDLPIAATADFLDQLQNVTVIKAWIYIGKFLDKYYSEHEFDVVDGNTVMWEHDPKIVDALVKSYKDQGHSGYSHMVVTQMIFEFFSGQMSEEEKEKIKGMRKN